MRVAFLIMSSSLIRVNLRQLLVAGGVAASTIKCVELSLRTHGAAKESFPVMTPVTVPAFLSFYQTPLTEGTWPPQLTQQKAVELFATQG